MTEGLQIERRYETLVCTYTLYSDGEVEIWQCEFKHAGHPVNKKAELFKMSGAEQDA